MGAEPRPRAVPAEEIERAIIAGYESEGTNPRTMYRVRSTLGLMIDGAGVSTPADLGPATIEWFREHHPHKLQTLQSIWNRAVRAGLVDPPAAPFADPHPPRSSADRTAPPTPEEVTRFAGHARGLIDDWLYHRDFALAALVRFTAMIVHEAIRLPVADIDLAGGVILSHRHEHTRWTRTPPRINVPPVLAGILAAWVPRTGCDWAFPGITRQGPWAASGNRTPQARMAILSRDAGLEEGRTITHEKLRRYHKERLLFPIESGWQESATSPATPRHTIRVDGPGLPVIIDGQVVPGKGLTVPQFAIVAAVLEAGADGITEKGIKEESGHGGGRNTLRRLKESHPLWDAIIRLAGTSHRRYCIDAVRLSGECAKS